MRDYLFHALQADGRSLSSAETVAFENDESAMCHALGSSFPHGCDLWCGYRLIGRFCGPARCAIAAADSSLAA
jgi:hypothetical protein